MEFLMVVLLTILTLFWLFLQTRKPANFPPGPPRLPFIGSMPFLVGRSRPDWHGLIQTAKSYGGIFGFWHGKRAIIFITDYEKMKELLKSDASTGRPDFRPFNEFRYEWKALGGTENEQRVAGIFLMDGKFWQEQRKFLLRNLKDFGFGNKGIEGLILEEVDKLILHLEKAVGQDISLRGIFDISIVNALMMVIFGKPLQLDNPKAIKFTKTINEFTRVANNLFFPMANFLPHPKIALSPGIFQLCGLDQLMHFMRSLSEFIKSFVEEHIKTFDPNSLKDFMDVYLAEVYKTKDANSSFYEEKGMCLAVNVLMDLFIAGADGTSSTLQWTFLYLLHHPTAKRKIQQEIDNVCRSTGVLKLEDKIDLPYTMAFLHESLRLSSMVPLGMPHRATTDIRLGEYIIPKNTTILPSLISVMRDPDYFEDPDVFRPDRFLTPEGKFKSCERVIPFGVGKRACVGQTLAEQQHFLFFAAIMKNFDVTPVSEDNLPCYDIRDWDANSFFHSPPEIKVIFSKR